MNPLYFLFVFLFSVSTFAANEEIVLQQQCSKGDLYACENLTAFYVKESKWENAFSLGEALCKRDVMKGCTFAGTAKLATGNAKDGVSFLTKSCDGFEPYACRSMARLMKQNKQELLSYMFNKRACHYGLDENCRNLKVPKTTYSQKGKDFLKKIFEECDDPKSSRCQESLKTLENCSQILEANDCLLIPGELSIYFKSKLFQESAKLELLNLVADQNALRKLPTQKRYSYDLKLLMKGKKVRSSYTYVFGFSKACTKKFERARDAESTSLALYKNSYADVSNRTKQNIAAFFYKGKAEDCYDPAFAYEAFAVANLDPENPARLDIWKINKDGNLVQLQNGLPQQ
jgi:hypothetical protein